MDPCIVRPMSWPHHAYHRRMSHPSTAPPGATPEPTDQAHPAAPLRVSILAAGAAGMYCGSCLRDNALARALLRKGHRVVMTPLYTPVRTDTPTPADSDIYFGGINIWLQSTSALFRRTPRFLDWLLDRPWLLRLVSRHADRTDARQLGRLTVAILEGHRGPAGKEFRRLADHLAHDVHPEVVTLPNAMFAAAAEPIHQSTGAPVICELTGEDIFLNALPEPWRSRALQLISQAARHVQRFVATSRYYADHAAACLGIDRRRIDVVYPGLPPESLTPTHSKRTGRTIGYFARICPEKGLHRLVDAYLLLRASQPADAPPVRLVSAGYMSPSQAPYLAAQQARLAQAGHAGDCHHLGELDLQQKLSMLASVDLLCVPTEYAEPKGIFLLEAMALGTPVVQPAIGAFPEVIQLTGGGVLCPPADAQALATALAALLDDTPRRLALGQAGAVAVRRLFTDDAMADGMLEVFARARCLA